jgi:hypothetical protein
VQELREPADSGHPPGRRLEADQPGVRRGPADRAAAVRADGERRQARRHRGHGAAARPAGGEAEVPWVPGRAEQAVAGVALDRELGDVGLADDDRARAAAQARDRQLVLIRHEAGVEERSPGRPHPAREKVVLHRDRHAIEGTQNPAARAAPVARARLLAGGVVESDDRVERRVEPLDAGERAIEEVGGRDLAPIEEPGERARRKAPEFRCHCSGFRHRRTVAASRGGVPPAWTSIEGGGKRIAPPAASGGRPNVETPRSFRMLFPQCCDGGGSAAGGGGPGP